MWSDCGDLKINIVHKKFSPLVFEHQATEYDHKNVDIIHEFTKSAEHN